MAGQKGLHKTEAIDISNYYLIALPKFANIMIKGNVEMFENRMIKSNNPITSVKGAFGGKQFPAFKNDIQAIVETKTV